MSTPADASASSPVPPRRKFIGYHWILLKHFGHEVWRTKGTEIMSSLVLSILTFLVSWILGDAKADRAFEIALISLVGWLAVFAFGHAIRTPWSIHKSEDVELNAENAHWGYGVIGGVVPLLILAGVIAIGMTWYVGRKPDNLMRFQAPPPPVVNSTQGLTVTLDPKLIQQLLRSNTRVESNSPKESPAQRAATLSSAILRYVEQRHKLEPGYSGGTDIAVWEKNRDLHTKFNNETKDEFLQRFAPRITSVIEDAKENGFDVSTLDTYCIRQSDYLERLQECAMKITEVANKLKQRD